MYVQLYIDKFAPQFHILLRQHKIIIKRKMDEVIGYVYTSWSLWVRIVSFSVILRLSSENILNEEKFVGVISLRPSIEEWFFWRSPLEISSTHCESACGFKC